MPPRRIIWKTIWGNELAIKRRGGTKRESPMQAPTINHDEIKFIRCRYGCKEAAGIYHIPDTHGSFSDPIQALCEHHYTLVRRMLPRNQRINWLVAKSETNATRVFKVIRDVLDHYQRLDDGAYLMLKGFAAKRGEGDPNSQARKALIILNTIQGESNEQN